MPLGPRDAERAYQFAQSHHLEVFVDQYEIEREEHPDGMNGIRRHDPNAAIGLQGSSPQQTDKTAYQRIRYLNSKREKSLSGLIVDVNVPRLPGHTRSFPPS